MEVIERKLVPIYEAECGECHSVLQYRAAEVHFTGYITCPVCGKSVWANTINPVRMEQQEADREDEP